MLDRVTSSCVQVGDTMVDMCPKYQSYMSMDLKCKYFWWYANLNISGYADAECTRISLIILLIVELKHKDLLFCCLGWAYSFKRLVFTAVNLPSIGDILFWRSDTAGI
jgi:hypothetical protein